ncbi:hypothetical protein [Enemella evansiae]|uniref:Uncharacterized protein n=1 Tax=Enemella evansiae TaxID=2016499 RepID=A0A255G637_9ACTN|nr:hypothetical protein [Enemella evansiae]PFG66747.1 hypothetical protein B0O41_1542 [Propionibacteriaceae bacterium ES.041]OYN93694.1 hypothetical protein CGZ96_20020 [Enemella evansiae]OYN97347.1 hypothetical protein CGZ95_15260 [Enemella evansiae]OYO05733.1 hypothetical protein CGZ97_03265 [Enemella evansiae]OYO09683.1 hypothetical protein CGZ94_18705 [Enemella evansiae]
MSSIVLFTLLALVIAAFVCGAVAMGMAGHGRSQHPKVAHGFARAAQALNGDGEPPSGLVKLFR